MSELPGRLVLLGHPLGHTLSPRFQNAALRAARIPLEYEALDVEPALVEPTLVRLARQRAAGNVTIPYKERIAERCARLTTLAERAGAVNTFWHEGGELIGDNTDVGGVDHAARRLLGGIPEGLIVGVLGAGGAAAAVLTAAERWPGARVLLVNRTSERAARLCARFSTLARVVDAPVLAAQAQLVVNATALGLRDDELPIDPALLRADAAALDLVYRRDKSDGTAWTRAVAASGRRALDGLAMLVEQGALAFERWFGVAPDRAAMWRAASNEG